MNATMLAFRSALSNADGRPIIAEIVREVCEQVTRPGNFFASDQVHVERKYQREEDVAWEIFQGRLLDASQTRERQRFETWGVYWIDAAGRSTEPIVAVRYDAGAERLHVTRAVLCHAHESYDTGGDVILAREVKKWQRELVGTIRLDALPDAGTLRDELACLLFQSVAGTSRLPLTSIEAPLPGFAFGQLGYFYQAPDNSPDAMTCLDALYRLLEDNTIASAERVKVYDFLVRATPNDELNALAERFGRESDALAMLRAVFNAVTLSPYTDFAPKVLSLVRLMSVRGTVRDTDRVDFLCHLIRQLARHLAAYDLRTFHHRGANYPDALLLDDVWSELLPLTAKRPELFAGEESVPRLRRRAVRLALLLQLEYVGHAVPDLPTSPGENLRVLPDPFCRVPEDQIYSPITRKRRLFTDSRLPALDFARTCFAELDKPAELRELGTVLFLDRPLGFAKLPGEPDQTPMMSHVMFSRSVAAERFGVLARHVELLPDEATVYRWKERLEDLQIDGLPLRNPGPPPRPGVVSLHDALRVSDDWLFLRTTRQTTREFERLLTACSNLTVPPLDQWRLVIPAGKDAKTLMIHDVGLRSRVELAADLSAGYRSRAGIEYPAAGFRLVRSVGDD
jgi:hypothetical protein